MPSRGRTPHQGLSCSNSIAVASQQSMMPQHRSVLILSLRMAPLICCCMTIREHRISPGADPSLILCKHELEHNIDRFEPA